jgi:creatinine amidohydrolase/Fe(II)-dependent formamide hydrolase-like protein
MTRPSPCALVSAALDAGKTTALFYSGGTEQRGPRNANGGHNLTARATVNAIALELGNAIAMPVLPYTPNTASATLSGTIGLTPEILAATLERIAEQAISTGFRNVVLMGDHGGGQPNVYAEAARKLEEWRRLGAVGPHRDGGRRPDSRTGTAARP